MSIFRTTPEAPTLEQRASSAAATASAALSVFQLAAADLEHAASVHADVAAEAHAEADRLRLLAAEAESDATQAVIQARKIRELAGGASA